MVFFYRAILLSSIHTVSWSVGASNILRPSSTDESLNMIKEKTKSGRCSKDEFLHTNQRLEEDETLCNYWEDAFLENYDCELHYNNEYNECHEELAEVSGNGCFLAMQNDGNLVYYDQRSRPVWKSDTRGKHAELNLDRDGTLIVQVPVGGDREENESVVIVQQNRRKAEITERKNCKDTRLKRGTTLRRNDYICDLYGRDHWEDPVGAYLGIDNSGYLVTGACSDCSKKRVSSKSSSSAYLQIHSDGNLVLYGSEGVLWESETRGKNSYVECEGSMAYIRTVIADCN